MKTRKKKIDDFQYRKPDIIESQRIIHHPSKIIGDRRCTIFRSNSHDTIILMDIEYAIFANIREQLYNENKKL